MTGVGHGPHSNTSRLDGNGKKTRAGSPGVGGGSILRARLI